MKAISDWIMRQYFKYRYTVIQKSMSDQEDSQKRILERIIHSNRNSAFGKEHGFDTINDREDYISHVSLHDYNTLFPYISRMMDGEKDILTSKTVTWFAKSSGTSTGRSKYIPVSKEYLIKGHLKCAWDAAAFIYHEDPAARLFADKSLIMGGTVERMPSGLYAGDISGIIIKHFPAVGRYFYTPDFETALMGDWDQKINKMAEICSKEKLVLVAGVPTWLLVLFRKILERTDADNISEVWPGLRTFLHGGVSFEPYRKHFELLLPSRDIRYREVYNASEGYFAIQDRSDAEGMLLLCDHCIYYEFVPWLGEDTDYNTAIGIDKIQVDHKYALVISNTSGLYRYIIGDVIRIVTLNPVRIQIAGRTDISINVFGEEVSVSNTDKALANVCEQMQALVRDYTVGPVFMTGNRKGGHEWYIEFDKEPVDIEKFTRALDDELRRLNSDYDAKRSYDLALVPLKVRHLSKGCFEIWMRQKGKYGGQNKVPRLRNDRQLLEELDHIIISL